MIQVGDLEAGPGEHTFGYLEVAESRSGLQPDIPVHLIAGAEPGPTLLVQSAIHGEEVVGSIAILDFVENLDPAEMAGNVIAVPVVNRAGFDQLSRGSPIDDKDISMLFPGDSEGSLSEQVAYTYFEEVITRADVMVDLHAGGRTAYERYVLFSAESDQENPTEIEERLRKLVVAFGVDKAAYFPPGTFDMDAGKTAIYDAGVTMFTLEFGGGTGWFEHGEENVRDAERGMWNLLKAMEVVDGEIEADGPECTVYEAGTVIWKPDVDGLFIRERTIGDELEADEVYGRLVDPYTGEELANLRAPEAGIVIPSGQNWFTIGATSVGILGRVDRVDDRETMDLTVSFD
jgi:hypothetical protein